jgi:hypothetical protein
VVFLFTVKSIRRKVIVANLAVAEMLYMSRKGVNNMA